MPAMETVTDKMVAEIHPNVNNPNHDFCIHIYDAEEYEQSKEGIREDLTPIIYVNVSVLPSGFPIFLLERSINDRFDYRLYNDFIQKFTRAYFESKTAYCWSVYLRYERTFHFDHSYELDAIVE